MTFLLEAGFLAEFALKNHQKSLQFEGNWWQYGDMLHQNPGDLLQLINRTSPSTHFVFDIDSTLVHLHKRNQSILKNFLEIPQTQKRFPEQTKNFFDAEFKISDWGLGDALERHGLTLEDNEFFSELKNHWLEKFFSNEFLHEDIPVHGAVDFANEIQNRGFQLSYLTGRNRPNMLEGTIKSLENCGFPLQKDYSNLHMKPSPDISDEAYKMDAFKEIIQDGEDVLFFENEPINLNRAAKDYPGMHLIFMDTTHSGKEHPPEKCFRIKDFAELASQLVT